MRSSRAGLPMSCAAGAPRSCFPARIHEDQALLGIEGEHRGVDLGHDGAKQGARLERVQPMSPQHLGEAVRLHIKEAQVVIGPGAAGAEREITLAHGGEEVGGRLDGANHVVIQHGEANDEHDGNHEGAGPLRARAIGTEPEESECQDERWQCGPERDGDGAARERRHGR